MNTKKLFMLLAAVLLGWETHAEEITINGLKYKCDDATMTATVVGTEEGFNDTDIVIPEMVNGYTVTVIGKKAFQSKQSIIHFKAPSTLLSIGYRAFAESENLQTIELSESLRSIDDAAFYKTTSLSEVYIPNSVTNLGSAFSESGIVSIHLPEGLSTIREYSFCDCKKLRDVCIPNSVTTIGYNAFSGCTSLQSVVIPASVREFNKNISDYYGTFENCSSLISIVVDEGNAYFDSRENSNAIISTADNCLLMGCNSTTIPHNVQKIYRNAFEGSGIQSITIPDNVIELGEGIFDECKNLVSAVLPNSINCIPDAMFSNCEKLSSISLPNSITCIGVSSFNHCYNLTQIQIPDGVTSIGARAFRHTGLKTLCTPRFLESVGEGAFRGCAELSQITLSQNVKTIERLAFADCKQLKSVNTLIIEPNELGEKAFENYDEGTGTWFFTTAILYIPCGTKEKYKVTAGWNQFLNIQEEDEDGIAEIKLKKERCEFYDLSGRRVSGMKKGINIKDGRKILK